MKVALFTTLLFCSAFLLRGQDSRPLPPTELKTVDGKNVSTALFDNNGKPIILSFWATWCKPCITELTNMAEYYEEWQAETGVKIIAVSIDDARNQARVAPFVLGKGWEYEVYVDVNSDLKRALNVNLVPHTFLLNGKKEIVWQHNSYTEGDEFRLYELVKKLATGQAVSE